VNKRILSLILLMILGAVLFTAAPHKPTVWSASCVGCGDCTIYCPTKAIHLEGEKAVIDAKKCINCKMCLTTCQYKAIR
jgi:ferredoxin